ncbi:hypothetical protein LCGC14_1050110 [marine sediment metagenome]|uniref:Uncharacterized protein n=1 Tax=marine sediment metagenome TaxID=412755 RepID=A0A0F9MP61_9ZZZZ
MIKLSKYVIGFKLKGSTDSVLISEALEKAKEFEYILLIPKSIVEEIKKGVTGEWE